MAPATVVVIGLVGVGWSLLGGEDEPESPGEVVAEFFHAYRAADCERLIEVVATRSWSDGGRLSRAEFLDQCNAALAGDTPTSDYELLAPESVSIRVEGDEAEVRTSDSDYLAGNSPSHELALAGSLVRQDGEWKVEAGEGLLRLGPSAAATVRSYFEAYANRECDRLADYVSEEAGQPLQARCEEQSQEPLRTPAIGPVQVSFDGDSKATVNFSVPSVGAATLVKEGLSWKVASFPVLPDELETKLLDEVAVNGQPCLEWSHPSDEPLPERLGDTEPQTFVRREFYDGQLRRDGGTCEITLTLYEFSSEEEALEAAGPITNDSTHVWMAHRNFVVEVELNDDDLEEYGSTDATAIATAQVDAL